MISISGEGRKRWCGKLKAMYLYNHRTCLAKGTVLRIELTLHLLRCSAFRSAWQQRVKHNFVNLSSVSVLRKPDFE